MQFRVIAIRRIACMLLALGISTGCFSLFTIFQFSSIALAGGENKPLSVLALYKSSEGRSEESNEISSLIEPALKQLKVQTEYHDIEASQPGPEYMQHFHAILTWFQSGNMSGAQNYCDWLVEQVRAGLRVVILGNMGAFVEIADGTPVDRREIERVFHSLGVHYDYQWTNNTDVIYIANKIPEMVEHEKKLLPKELIYYEKIYSIHPENEIYLTLGRKDQEDSDSDLIVITPFGGLAYGPYVVYQNPQSWQTRWYLNIQQFLSRAFGETR